MLGNIIKKLFIIVIIISTFYKIAYSDSRISNIRKNYILNELKPDVRYTPKENIEEFKKIFIGWWAAPPHEEYKFLENGIYYYTRNYEEGNKNIKGKWKLDGNNLYLKLDGDKKWHIYFINYYMLQYSEDMLGNKLNNCAVYLELEDKNNGTISLIIWIQ